MSSTQQSKGLARFVVENVGGIGQTDVELPPGVTVLEGKNATNRTSFLQAIMAAMGSDRVTLKGDADEGEVHLEFDSDRIAALVEYFAEYADFLVVALLPEDAQALTDSYNSITSI